MATPPGDLTLKKDLFQLPDGIIYLDGNSLGPLPDNAARRVQNMLCDEWGGMLIKGWNEAGWFQQPRRIGDRIGQLIGAAQSSVVVGDTLSIKVYQALAAALAMRADRRIILSDSGNFPTDLYMAEGLIKTMNRGLSLKLVAPEEVAANIDENVAVVMLTHVDYRTGRMHDMEALTKKAHASGAIALWDLAHSAGAVPLDIAGCAAEFAVGCTYKYLNAGPGAPAFIYVRPDIVEQAEPCLSGWMGHVTPFEFEPGYQPAASIERMRVGTPPVIQLAALDAALDVWDDVSMQDIRIRSLQLSERFIAEVERQCPQLKLASPRDQNQRGSQVSFSFENGYAVIQALIAEGVIGDFRAPDIMRFGMTPLYLDESDIIKAVAILADIMKKRKWDNPEFMQKNAVT
ncbi:MAG: kynureninase [Gammaproteobacteria bacterium]|nr:kynureninase [Gammaproteobacteria bacterium]